MEQSSGLLSALLKYWRKKRGLSQLDLGLAVDISARHLSFIETGRAKPSKETLLIIADALSVPLREQNSLMRAAGFEDVFEEQSYAELVNSPIGNVMDMMLNKHDPYPMVVMDANYNLIQANKSAEKILSFFVAKPENMSPNVNLLEMIFNPDLSRPYVQDWESAAHRMLSRLHREALSMNHNPALQDLLSRILDFPGVPRAWCHPDFSSDCDPTATLSLKKGRWNLSFLMTMTSFSAPQNITLEELKIESYFPLNTETARQCEEILNITSDEM